MPKAKKIPRNDLGIPENQMESLARILLPILRDYLESDEGRKDYEEWKLQKETLQDMDKSATDMEQ